MTKLRHWRVLKRSAKMGLLPHDGVPAVVAAAAPSAAVVEC